MGVGGLENGRPPPSDCQLVAGFLVVNSSAVRCIFNLHCEGEGQSTPRGLESVGKGGGPWEGKQRRGQDPPIER